MQIKIQENIAILNSRFKDFDNPKIFNVYGHTPTENTIINKYKAPIDLGGMCICIGK